MAEVEETFQRVEANRSVIGTIIASADGLPVRSTFESSKAARYVGILGHLTTMATSTVRDIDPQNDLTVLRIGTKNQEIMVAPENGFLVIVLQRCDG
ncbi:dynein light chain roadblock-type 2-like [Syngnathus acus]|uniref:dynein light chain roadblock-type 2-like n=1 Tax=Syngnathus acus TaxID=161584 RepID=UPI001885D87B|nr:dynein light chain roadblock-type 2-like [Syngnathus acus]XP_037110707.1 dynein light chain roadblock-type 2-like [Syngnathus acus]